MSVDNKVTYRDGTIEGAVEKGIVAFYNIPYGTDAGRFMDTHQPQPWEGVRDGTKPGTVFPQFRSDPRSLLGVDPFEQFQSEDSFTLNVWTSGIQHLKPVFFWIHGGGWQAGGGSLAWHNGSSLASSGDVVVVTINYRLGILGNFNDGENARGNQGLQDIINALTWVKENIAAFGGDPDCITIAGQSAGAWYSVVLMGIEQIRNLFKRVALFSFPGDLNAYPQEKSRELSRAFLGAAGSEDMSFQEAQALPIERLLFAQVQASRRMQKQWKMELPPYYVPHRDGELIRGPVIEQAARVSCGAHQTLAGTTTHEMSLFLYTTPYKNAPEYMDLVLSHTQAVFTEPTRNLLNQLRTEGANTYAYELAYGTTDPRLLACHCFELPFLFNNFEYWMDPPLLAGLDEDTKKHFASCFQRAIINFVVAGNPNGSSTFDWPEYEGALETVLHIDEALISSQCSSRHR